MTLEGKKILVCICGGIAAYKINHLIRDFVKKGAEVQALLTPAAEDFVSKLTISTSVSYTHLDVYKRQRIAFNTMDN